MLLCHFITGLKHVDRACASEILQSKYIASLFTKRMKDVILELYMLLCFCYAVDSILHNDPYGGQITDFFIKYTTHLKWISRF